MWSCNPPRNMIKKLFFLNRQEEEYHGEQPQRKRRVEALAQGKITFSSMFCSKSPLNYSNNLENNSKGIYGSNLRVKRLQTFAQNLSFSL